MLTHTHLRHGAMFAPSGTASGGYAPAARRPRRHAVGVLLLACGGLFAARATLAGPAQPAVPALVAEFARHPVVAIAEYHGLRQAGDFYISLVCDPAFQRTVNDIVIEFASGQSQSLLDRYIV